MQWANELGVGQPQHGDATSRPLGDDWRRALRSQPPWAVPGRSWRKMPRSFYKGKQISLIVGYGPGGGYDVYGAACLPGISAAIIPGQPSIVVQNMPGAGSLVATNYLYRIAPKDGSVFGIFARNMPLVGLLGTKQNVQFDPVRFTWLGSSSSLATTPTCCWSRKAAQGQDARGHCGTPAARRW